MPKGFRRHEAQAMPDQTLSARELGSLLGISDRMVRELAERGQVSRAGRGRYHLAASVTAYCTHLRGIAAGRGGDDQVATLSTERARLAKEQADAAALKNAALRGSMVHVADVEREWVDVLRTVRAGVLALPSQVQQRLPHLSKEHRHRGSDCASANEIASLQPSNVRKASAFHGRGDDVLSCVSIFAATA